MFKPASSIFAITFLASCCFPQPALFAQEDLDLAALLDMSLSDLANIEVSLASGTEESMRDAPAAIIVITAEEISQRGYTSLDEVLMDLPGFDISVTNGANYLTAYQRGYRTPFTQRTLLMIDGRVENHLWSHVAHFSRQYQLTNIKKIEVLYGPASAVYGPNAFLGIINIITRDGADLASGQTATTASIQAGSFNTRAAEVSTRGRFGDLHYSLSARLFKSDEPDLSDKWGFNSNDLYSDRKTWGPLLNFESNGKKLGEYFDPSDDYGISGSFGYKGLKLGFASWVIEEGYGVHYPADRAQSNVPWENSSRLFFAEFNKEISAKLKAHSLVAYRESDQGGQWAEATPDWNPGMEDFSYISLTNWNSVSNSWLFKQEAELKLNENIRLLTGIKFERKELTMAYDVPGYWDAFSSSVPSDDPGPHGQGAGIGHSSDDSYTIPPPPSKDMPQANLIDTEDYGGFVQGIFDLNKYRFNAGVRWDHNSVYGNTVNPRVSAIHKYSAKCTFKLLYGEAFQEPAPMQLWGGWSGRLANPDLKPEKVRNLEFIAMYQTGRLSHDFSLYRAQYENVLKEEAENAGERKVYGLEYRSRFSFPNFIHGSADITGFLYYTYTDSKSSIHYDQLTGSWQEGEAELGDIAPHKVNVGANIPVTNRLNLFLGGIYVGEKELYLRNPLRARGEKLDSYFVMNCNVRYVVEQISFSCKVRNLFDREYFHSGVESASAGDDFSHRSLGWHNSLHPGQGRSFLFSLNVDF